MNISGCNCNFARALSIFDLKFLSLGFLEDFWVTPPTGQVW